MVILKFIFWALLGLFFFPLFGGVPNHKEILGILCFIFAAVIAYNELKKL